MSQAETATVALTHTAKSKAFRYLKAHEIEQHVREPDDVFHDTLRDNYKLPVNRRSDRVVIIVKPIPEESKYLVVSQTGDHFDWSEYEKVDCLPEVME